MPNSFDSELSFSEWEFPLTVTYFYANPENKGYVVIEDNTKEDLPNLEMKLYKFLGVDLEKGRAVLDLTDFKEWVISKEWVCLNIENILTKMIKEEDLDKPIHDILINLWKG